MSSVASLDLTASERARLTESIVTHAYERDISSERLREIVKGSVPRKADALCRHLEQLWEKWNSTSVRSKIWEYYRQRLLPRFERLRRDNAYAFDELPESPSSLFWTPSLCLLALWKFDYEEHRPSIYEDVADRESDSLRQYEQLRHTIRDIWTTGRDWLDSEGARLDYQLPVVGRRKHSVVDGQTEYNVAINEQAMYLFCRSHLAWEDQVLTHPVPAQVVQNLLDSRLESGFWPDLTRPAQEEDGLPSLRATSISLSALGDWQQYTSIALDDDPAYEDWKVSAGAKSALDGEGEQQLRDIPKVCADSLERLLQCQLGDGSWPRYVRTDDGDEKGDLRATSLAVYALDRFAADYRVRIPDGSLLRAEQWLQDQVSAQIIGESAGNGTRPNTPWDFEQAALAVTVLARRVHPTLTLWLRSAVKYLLSDLDSGSVPGPEQPIGSAEAWQIYGIIEVIRRKTCVEYLNRRL